MVSLDSFILIILLGVGILLLALAVFFVFFGLWVYHDAKDRSTQSPALWTAIVLLVPNFIGLIIYLLVGRNKEDGVSSGRFKKAAIISCISFFVVTILFVFSTIAFALVSYDNVGYNQIHTIREMPAEIQIITPSNN